MKTEINNNKVAGSEQIIMTQVPIRKKNAHLRLSITILIFILAYFLAPLRTNLLILGTDYLPPRDILSRTDTNIVVTVIPLKPYVGILSIPRDLWVVIPGIGENRINTAYFYGEMDQKGSGPEKSIETIRSNFGLTLQYYLVIKMAGFINVIDALGGVVVNLTDPMGGLTAGKHHLDGKEALAFARERYSADDFSRMKQGQILLKALLMKLLSPGGWIRIPAVFVETNKIIDTNVPFWMLPRLGLALIRVGPDGIDNRVITREMVNPFTTSEGAQVLTPNWGKINPVLMGMFGE